MFSPAVITSRKAQDYHNTIVGQHADLLKGYALQSQKVAAYRQQKEAELANENAMKQEMEKEKMTADTQVHKDSLDFAQKQAELDIKRAALSAVD